MKERLLLSGCGTRNLGVLKDDRITLHKTSREWIIKDNCVYEGEHFIGQLHGDAITSMTGECLYTLKMEEECEQT